MTLTQSDLALLAAAGFVAGVVNSVAGGGSLISYPAFLLTGFNALVANVTNTVALVPGYFGGTLGYRKELEGQSGRVRVLAIVATLGAVTGSFLLVISTPSLFETIVPWLIVVACILFACQKRLNVLVLAQSSRVDHLRSPAHLMGQFVAAAYGAYFGAGLGIVLLAVEGMFLEDSLQRLNALKSFLSLIINVVALIYFALFATVGWAAVPVVLVASLAGGRVGASVARRIPDAVLRAFVIVTGLAVATRLLVA